MTSQQPPSYAKKTPSSQQLYQRARNVFPSGVTHDVRYLRPHPLFVSRAQGPRKWDVDGNEYVDYFGGHGALILGHNHPAVVEAVKQQIERGVHYGASHELELEWGELIQSMVPSAERVRFTVSGTEATHLALRVARAFTGKPAVIRFATHFHGWHDQVAFGRRPAETAPEGILPEIIQNTMVCPPADITAVKGLLEQRDDVAAVILEPTGATFGKVPVNPRFLEDLRRLTREQRVVLIFDEVITGFRCSPGGAQGFYGVTPDLTTLAKILAGGYPGAALAGRADIMGVMEYRQGETGILGPRVPHQGTYNAGPVSAAAGITTLKLLQSGEIIEQANRTAATLRDEMNGVIRRLGSPWCVYGGFSGFHIFANPANEPLEPEDLQNGKVSYEKVTSVPADLFHQIRVEMLSNGVDVLPWPGGPVSGVHGQDDIDRTLSAFEQTVKALAGHGRMA